MIDVSEIPRGAADSAVIELATRDSRIAITEDGTSAASYSPAGSTPTHGVIFIRCPEVARAQLPTSIVSTVDSLGVSH